MDPTGVSTGGTAIGTSVGGSMVGCSVGESSGVAVGFGPVVGASGNCPFVNFDTHQIVLARNGIVKGYYVKWKVERI